MDTHVYFQSGAHVICALGWSAGIAGNAVQGMIRATERQHISHQDIGRTIPIDTHYITTLDTKTEARDKVFLEAQGKYAVERFARDLRGEAFAAEPVPRRPDDDPSSEEESES